MEALRASERRVVGTKEVLRAIKAGTASRVYVANDVDTFLYQRIVRAAETARIPVTRVERMKDLGEACGVQVSAAAAAVIK